MIIEDNPGDQLLTKIQIEEYDPTIEVLQAYDGLEALEMLNSTSSQPDVIFTDVNMPRMNGLEFIKRYSKKKESEKTIVAMLSSSVHEVDKKQAFSYKCVKHYFQKLLEKADLDLIQGSA